MGLYVYAVKPADEKWHQMKEIWDRCTAVGIDPPSEVERFFDGEYPDSDGKLIDISDEPYVTEYSAEMVEGYDINVENLPKDTKQIRVTYVY